MSCFSFIHQALGRCVARRKPCKGRHPAPVRTFGITFGKTNLPLGLALLASCIAPAGLAQASTFASIVPTLRPDRPHARATLKLAIQFEGGEAGVPAPLRHAELHLPANLDLEIPQLRSCSATVLEVRGPAGCPSRSLIGGGSALVEGELDSQAVTESVSLQAFLGPLRNLQPTFEILAGGYQPIGAQVVLTATASPDRAPYGEVLAMSVEPISTVPSEPNASVLTFTLTIGRPQAGRHAPAVIVPARCPRGGFPFAGEFTYADGTSSRVYATAPCPK